MSNFSASDLFQVALPVREAADRDRSAIVEYLHQYLCTGVAPVAPRLEAAARQIRDDNGREPLGQAAWKWSELTGKYYGCPFWSVAAFRLVSGLAERRPLDRLRAVCAAASKKNREPDSIQHEHVFRREHWRQMMAVFVRSAEPLSVADLVDLLDRYCVGCVVTRSEHERLGVQPSDRTNPWKRYSGTSIKLVDNPAWPQRHRAWIVEAGLL